uniref:Uncharacterized protein n=1 Tax=Manihot esculenta TaxID=3983 RepID=A0A2C9U2K5_MANES
MHQPIRYKGYKLLAGKCTTLNPTMRNVNSKQFRLVTDT